MLYSLIVSACWLVFVIFWAVSAVGVKRDIDRSSWQQFWLLRIIIIVAVINAIAYSNFARNLNYRFNAFSTFSQETQLAALGALLCVIGIGLAIWARVHIGRNWSGVPSIKEGHELVTSGPYRLIRHPIYTGMILALLGSAFATSAWWLVAFFIVTAMFIWRVRVEESLMTKQFPEQYSEYKKRTWALVPYIW